MEACGKVDQKLRSASPIFHVGNETFFHSFDSIGHYFIFVVSNNDEPGNRDQEDQTE
jgi:hypothetical protein